MPQTFKCPACGSLLDAPEDGAASLRCGLCSAIIPAPDALRAAPPELAQIKAQIQAGNKIEAIKLYRQLYGVGLLEAKDAVEALEKGVPVPAAAAPAPPSPPEMAEILALVRANLKIEAIKLYRQRYGVGLKEAKDAVEALERGQPLPPAPSPYQPALDAGGKRAGGCAAVLLVCLLLLAASLAAI